MTSTSSRLVSEAPTSLPFLFSFPLALSTPTSFLLPQSLWKIWQEPSCLFSFTIRLQWVPRHSLVLENDAADELATRSALLGPLAIPCSLSRLISRIYSSLLSDWRRTVSATSYLALVSLEFGLSYSSTHSKTYYHVITHCHERLKTSHLVYNHWNVFLCPISFCVINLI